MIKKELRVLMVEDSAPDVSLIHHELRKAGLSFRSRRVDSREAFLHELENHPPDVILSDHGVPGFDGFAALGEVRTRCPETPFIFVTGYCSESEVEEMLGSGANDYVLKSNLPSLAPAIERALHEAEIRVQKGPPGAATKNEQHPQNNAAAIREFEEFGHAIAVDLRVPLRHIESFSEILLKSQNGRMDPKSLGYLKTVSESAHTMSRLIDDLFTFSRVGRAEMYHIHLSLADIVREVIGDLRRETEDREVVWEVGVLPGIVGDPVMLWLVLTNVIGNSLKFTRPRPVARIEIGSRSDDLEHIIFVRDNGVGFDPEQAGRLFNVGQRLCPKEFEGTGVGLVNVRRIIQRHGGRVWAEGARDEGATFFFSIPREAEAQSGRSSTTDEHR